MEHHVDNLFKWFRGESSFFCVCSFAVTLRLFQKANGQQPKSPKQNSDAHPCVLRDTSSLQKAGGMTSSCFHICCLFRVKPSSRPCISICRLFLGSVPCITFSITACIRRSPLRSRTKAAASKLPFLLPCQLLFLCPILPPTT